MKNRLLSFFIYAMFASFTASAQNNLNPEWLLNPKNTQPLGGPRSAKATAVDAAGNIYVTGDFSGFTDFDPSPDSLNIRSVPNFDTNKGATPHSRDIYIAKYSSSGALLWVRTAGDYGDDTGNAIVLDAAGAVYVTGSFRYTINFNPSDPASALTSGGVDDIFLAKFDTNGNHVWSKSMGGAYSAEARGIALDQANHIYITGLFTLNANFDPAGNAVLVSKGNEDIFFAKYDASGNYIWAKSIGGNSFNDAGNDIVLDANNNIYLTGYFNKTVDFDPAGSGGIAEITASGSRDAFIAKYDSNGAYLWAKGVEADGNFDQGNSIALDGQDVFLTGSYSGNAVFDLIDPNGSVSSRSSSRDVFLAKYDQLGVFKWVNSIGGTSVDEAKKVFVFGGKVYLMGLFQYTFFHDPANSSASISGGVINTFIAEYDALSGAYSWINALRNVSGGGMIVKNSDLHVTGSFTGSVAFDPASPATVLTAVPNSVDLFIGKYNAASGVYNLAVKFGEYPKVELSDEVRAIAQDNQGNIYAGGSMQGMVNFNPNGDAPFNATDPTGNASHDAFVVKYNGSGDYVWARAMGGVNQDFVTGVKADNAGNVYVTGVFQGVAYFNLPSKTDGVLSHPQTYTASFIAKYDINGNFLWAKKIGGIGTSSVNSTAIDLGPANSIYITGHFKGTINFNPEGGGQHESKNGSDDGFVAKYDNDGNYIWANRYGGNSNDRATSVVVNAVGEAYVGGYFSSSSLSDLTFSNSPAGLKSKGGSDMFLAKYDAAGDYIWSHGVGGSGSDVISAVALDNVGDLYVTGYFSNIVNFRDPPATKYELESFANSSLSSFFVAKFTSGSGFVWARSMVSTYSNGRGIGVDGQGNVYVTGLFGDEGNFGGISLFSTPPYGNGYVAKYGSINGNLLDATKLGSISNASGTALSVNTAGEVAVGGEFHLTMNTNSDSGSLSTASINAQDMFIVKFQASGALPVTLTNFTVNKANDYVKLAWQTASENNNKEFAVLRSTDGSTYIELSRITGAGDSNSIKNYAFEDRHASNGTNYYKLVQYDFDGTETDHGVRAIKFGLESAVAVYPNPTSDEVQVAFSQKQYNSVRLFSSAGILLEDIPLAPSQKMLSISLIKYPSGIYILKLEGKEGVLTKKIIKE